MRVTPMALPVGWLAACVILAACGGGGSPKAPGRSYYIAPTGKAQALGSATDPWDMVTALSHPEALRGNDTLWLRGGTYQGSFISSIAGEENARIVVRQAPGEDAIIDGSLEVRGQYATYWGFEVLNSNPVRVTATAGSDPADYKRPTGVVVHGRGTRLVNLVVHDAGSGVGMWMPAIDAEVYGCVIYNNGWQGPDRGYGTGIAAQNETGTKRIRDNVVFQQFNDGIRIYGSEESFLTGFDVEGNTSFDNGLLSQTRFATDVFIGGATPMARIKVSNNYTFRSDGLGTARFGYEKAIINDDLMLTNNYFVGQTFLDNWKTATVEGNTFTGAQNLLEIRVPEGKTVRDYKWDGNAYYPDQRRRALNSTMPIVAIENDSGRGFTFDDWTKTTGRDGGGRSATAPSGMQVFVRPNQYEKGRAHVIVYNWSRATSVAVDLSDVLDKGDRYEIRSIYDLRGAPAVSGVFPGRPYSMPFLKADPIDIPIAASRPTAAVGVPPLSSEGGVPEFAVFLVRRAAANAR